VHHGLPGGRPSGHTGIKRAPGGAAVSDVVEYPGLMECLVHDSPPDAPVSPNTPSGIYRKAAQSSEITLLTLPEQLPSGRLEEVQEVLTADAIGSSRVA
jgi:hypothetical protein